MARVGLECLDEQLDRKLEKNDRNTEIRSVGSVLFKAGNLALLQLESEVTEKIDRKEGRQRQLQNIQDATGSSHEMDLADKSIRSLTMSMELEQCSLSECSSMDNQAASEAITSKDYESDDDEYLSDSDQSSPLSRFDSSFYETAREPSSSKMSSSLLHQIPELIQASEQENDRMYPRNGGKSSLKSVYRLLETMGEGSYGVVIKAEHRLDKQIYALKCIVTTDVFSHSVLNEVNAMACLHHSNIVPYHDAFIEPAKDNYEIIDRFTKRDVREYISSVWNSQSETESSIPREPSLIIIKMQLCNESLDDWLQNNRSSRRPASMLQWIRQLCDGLDYIHKLNIIHNDFKPHNIFVDKKHCLQIGDFGLLTRLEGTANAAAAYGKGSNLYRSPEQKERQTGLEISYEVAQKVDMFALGLVIYEMCYDMEDHEERIKCFKQLREHRTIKEGLEDRYIRELILDLTKEDPNKRPSAEDVIMCLDIHQNGFVPVNTYRDTFVNFVNQRYVMERKNPVKMPTDLVLTNIFRAVIGPFSEFDNRSSGDYHIPGDFCKGIHIIEDVIKNHKRMAHMVIKLLKMLRGESANETRINILTVALEGMLEKREELYPFFEQVFQSQRLRKSKNKSTGDRIVEAINHLAFLISLIHNPYVDDNKNNTDYRYNSNSNLSIADTTSTADFL